MIQRHVVYIHGLGSDARSRKFRLIEVFFENSITVECLEWREDDNIFRLLEDTVTRLRFFYRELIIIGDSTGGNFAYQLRQLFEEYNLKTSLILLNPMLDISKRKRNVSLSENLLQYVQEIKNPTNALIILSKDDEVIDHYWLLESTFKGVEVIEVDDTHRMFYFSDYFPPIVLKILAKEL